nr:immunoglobulin heavy chain junction region [Mus musculus]
CARSLGRGAYFDYW